jgi:PAS domain S-box-containing protein
MGLIRGKQNPINVAPKSADDEQKLSKQLSVNEEENHILFVRDQTPSHDYLPYLARATNDAVRDWDVTRNILSWRQGLENLFGYKEASPKSSISFWEERVHPADRARISASLGEALRADTDSWTGEYRFRCANGNYLQILERAFVVRDADKKAIRVIGSLMDITARKQLHDQVSRSQKMEAFGQLAGGVAHDFNNFLTTILGYSDLVLGETGTGPIAHHIDEIRKAAGRASTLAGQLLAFSRRQALEPHVVEVNSILTNLERSLLRLLGENITVVCDLHQNKTGAHIKVDAGQLTQIIINLALNARDAMPGRGQLKLKTAATSLKEGHTISTLDGLAPGDYVVISVIDNGSGMSEEAKAHVFEPFFTTKENGRHSGLGLATSYGIVRQSGGRIRVESESGKGTVVDIYLPKVPAPPPPSYRKPSSRLLPKGTESIMVLEDDVSVRHISVRILRNLGYEVIEAANCDDAQRLIIERIDQAVHLLLTDMVMPQMSGRDFANWLRKASPKTKVVFVSGYLEESIKPGERIENGMFFLPKPFDPEELATTIRRALDS